MPLDRALSGVIVSLFIIIPFVWLEFILLHVFFLFFNTKILKIRTLAPFKNENLAYYIVVYLLIRQFSPLDCEQLTGRTCLIIPSA